MICDVCGSVTENVWAYDYYALLSGEKYIRCPECRTPIFADGLRYVLEFRYNHNHDSKGRFCSGSGEGAGAGNGIDKSSKTGYNDNNNNGISITDEAVAKVPKMNVFEDDNINRVIQQHSKELLTEARKYPVGTELGAVIELNAPDKLSGNKFHKGNDGEFTVSIPKCPSLGVTIHNHPSGETFSMSDIKNFSSDSNAKVLYVVGNNGKCYALAKNNNFDWIIFQRKLFDIEDLPECRDIILRGDKSYGFTYYES